MFVRTRVLLLCLLVACCLLADNPTAAQLYEKGRRAEKSGRMAEAYIMYSEAAAMEPKNQTYWLRSQAVRSRAALEAKPMPQEAAEQAAYDGPGDALEAVIEPPTAQDRIDAAKPLPPTELNAERGVKDLDFRGNFEELFQQAAHVYGLDCVFDGDYQPGKPFRFQLKGVDYREALHGLEAATGSFIVPITGKVFMVVKDSATKRQQVEPQIAVSVHLNETQTAQDFTSMITAVQQTFAIEKVAFDTQNKTVYLRGPMSKVLPARVMFEDLLHPKAQLAIEIKLIEVSRNDTLTYGLQLPTGPVTVGPLPMTLQRLFQLSVFNSSAIPIVYQSLSSAIVAQLSKSSGKTLLDAELRSVDGQAATLHAGQRYPVLTAGYFGPASFSGPGAYTPPPSFTFQDLGLNLKLTPTIQSVVSVALDVEAEFKVLTGESVNGIPVIASRALKSGVQLSFGEWTMVSGLLDTNDARTLSGIPGLSQLPYVGKVAGTHEHDRTSDEVLLLIRPSLITLPPSEYTTHSFDLGSDLRPLTPL